MSYFIKNKIKKAMKNPIFILYKLVADKSVIVKLVVKPRSRNEY